jgi:hypothetical protein
MVPWIIRNLLWFPVFGAVLMGGLVWLRRRWGAKGKGYKAVEGMA